MQAQLPGCLPNSTPARLQQDLNALASTYANLHKGECSVRKQVLLDSSAVRQQGALLPTECVLSPAGTAATLSWSDAARPGMEPSVVGLELALEGSSPGTWLVPVHDDMEALEGDMMFAAIKWSASGRLAVIRRGGAGVPGLVLRVFDVQRRCWLRELRLCPDLPGCFALAPQFTECDSGLACLLIDPMSSTGANGLITVCNVPDGLVQRFPAASPATMVWLPGSTTLLLWCDTGIALCSMPSRMQPSARSLRWHTIPNPGPYAAPNDTCLAAVPGGKSVVALLWTRASQLQGQAKLFLGLRSTSPPFKLLSNKYVTLLMPRGMSCADRDFGASILASHRAIVMTYVHDADSSLQPALGTWVYSLTDTSTLGPLLYRKPGLTCISLSPGSKFMAGMMLNTVCVFDLLSGSTLMQLDPSRCLSGPPELLNKSIRLHNVKWCGMELLVTASRKAKRPLGAQGHRDVVFSMLHA